MTLKSDGKSADRAEALEKPRRQHRATGERRGGRRVYAEDGSVQHQHAYSHQIATEILNRMAAGETVEKICNSRPDMPTARAVRQWKYDIPGFGAVYAHARELQAEAWADGIAALAEADDIDPSVRRVKFDIKRWLMSKHAPQTYGDKLTVAGDPAAPLMHLHRVADLIDGLSDAELDALERFAQARIEAQEAQHEDVADADAAIAQSERKKRGLV